MANQQSSTTSDFPPITHRQLVEKVNLMAQTAESWDQFDAQFLPFSAYYRTQSCACCGVDFDKFLTAIGVSTDQVRKENLPSELAKMIDLELFLARITRGVFAAALQRAARRGHEG